MKQAKGFRKYIGLMFRTRKTEPLEFVFEKPVLIPLHSMFVFFSFHACWFCENANLIEKRLVKPFSWNIQPNRKFKYLVEVPIR